MKIAIGSDHRGFLLKEEVRKRLEQENVICEDFGTFSEERTDYPIYAKKVAEKVSKKECEKGILVCRSGDGMAIVANKFKGVRAANISNPEVAKFSKADDNINVIALGGDYVTTNQAINIIRNWLGTEFKGRKI